MTLVTSLQIAAREHASIKEYLWSIKAARSFSGRSAPSAKRAARSYTSDEPFKGPTQKALPKRTWSLIDPRPNLGLAKLEDKLFPNIRFHGSSMVIFTSKKNWLKFCVKHIALSNREARGNGFRNETSHSSCALQFGTQNLMQIWSTCCILAVTSQTPWIVPAGTQKARLTVVAVRENLGNAPGILDV